MVEKEEKKGIKKKEKVGKKDRKNTTVARLPNLQTHTCSARITIIVRFVFYQYKLQQDFK